MTNKKLYSNNYSIDYDNISELLSKDYASGVYNVSTNAKLKVSLLRSLLNEDGDKKAYYVGIEFDKTFDVEPVETIRSNNKGFNRPDIRDYDNTLHYKAPLSLDLWSDMVTYCKHNKESAAKFLECKEDMFDIKLHLRIYIDYIYNPTIYNSFIQHAWDRLETTTDNIFYSQVDINVDNAIKHDYPKFVNKLKRYIYYYILLKYINEPHIINSMDPDLNKRVDDNTLRWTYYGKTDNLTGGFKPNFDRYRLLVKKFADQIKQRPDYINDAWTIPSSAIYPSLNHIPGSAFSMLIGYDKPWWFCTSSRGDITVTGLPEYCYYKRLIHGNYTVKSWSKETVKLADVDSNKAGKLICGIYIPPLANSKTTYGDKKPQIIYALNDISNYTHIKTLISRLGSAVYNYDTKETDLYQEMINYPSQRFPDHMIDPVTGGDSTEDTKYGKWYPDTILSRHDGRVATVNYAWIIKPHVRLPKLMDMHPMVDVGYTVYGYQRTNPCPNYDIVHYSSDIGFNPGRNSDVSSIRNNIHTAMDKNAFRYDQIDMYLHMLPKNDKYDDDGTLESISIDHHQIHNTTFESLWWIKDPSVPGFKYNNNEDMLIKLQNGNRAPTDNFLLTPNDSNYFSRLYSSRHLNSNGENFSFNIVNPHIVLKLGRADNIVIGAGHNKVITYQGKKYTKAFDTEDHLSYLSSLTDYNPWTGVSGGPDGKSVHWVHNTYTMPIPILDTKIINDFETFITLYQRYRMSNWIEPVAARKYAEKLEQLRRANNKTEKIITYREIYDNSDTFKYLIKKDDILEKVLPNLSNLDIRVIPARKENNKSLIIIKIDPNKTPLSQTEEKLLNMILNKDGYDKFDENSRVKSSRNFNAEDITNKLELGELPIDNIHMTVRKYQLTKLNKEISLLIYESAGNMYYNVIKDGRLVYKSKIYTTRSIAGPNEKGLINKNMILDLLTNINKDSLDEILADYNISLDLQNTVDNSELVNKLIKNKDKNYTLEGLHTVNKLTVPNLVNTVVTQINSGINDTKNILEITDTEVNIGNHIDPIYIASPYVYTVKNTLNSIEGLNTPLEDSEIAVKASETPWYPINIYGNGEIDHVNATTVGKIYFPSYPLYNKYYAVFNSTVPSLTLKITGHLLYVKDVDQAKGKYKFLFIGNHDVYKYATKEISKNIKDYDKPTMVRSYTVNPETIENWNRFKQFKVVLKVKSILHGVTNVQYLKTLYFSKEDIENKNAYFFDMGSQYYPFGYLAFGFEYRVISTANSTVNIKRPYLNIVKNMDYSNDATFASNRTEYFFDIEIYGR